MTSPFDPVKWMAEHGHPSYAAEINELHAVRNEIMGDAGRYWQFCEITQHQLANIDAVIEEVRQAAEDRYTDWATDPLD
jgi:hypothetical protein